MKRWIFGTAALAALLWIISIPQGTFDGLEFFGVRRQIMFFSGFVTYIMMAWVMVLALRLPVVERMVGGLDRVYRLHKWMGISAIVLALLHWGMGQIPKWLVQAGVLVKPAKHAAAADDVSSFNWIGFAENIGEWAFYAVLVLIVIALLRKIPYHWFRRAHKLIAVGFLILTFHAVVLIPANMWLTPAGLLGAIAVAAGTLAALASLFNLIGRLKKHGAVVEHIERLPGNMMRVRCTLNSARMIYQPGQFAFARFEGTKDPHPFSMSAYDENMNAVTFCIKALGDDTTYLLQHLHEGSRVTIEGPYGQFNFAPTGDTEEEVWVAGGVGVTPFLARLEYLVQQKTALEKPIRFFYCSQPNNPLLPRVTDLCTRTGVALHVFDEKKDGSLTLEKILGHAQRPAQMWFCGPLRLGDMLQHAWQTMRLPASRFHREYFQMR
jgi:Predicted ferric reductase